MAFGALAGISGKDLQADLAAADALFGQSRWDDAVTAYKAIMDKAPILARRQPRKICGRSSQQEGLRRGDGRVQHDPQVGS